MAFTISEEQFEAIALENRERSLMDALTMIVASEVDADPGSDVAERLAEARDSVKQVLAADPHRDVRAMTDALACLVAATRAASFEKRPDSYLAGIMVAYAMVWSA